MKWLGIIVRTLVGLMFFVFGLNFFFNFIDLSGKMATMPDEAKQYLGLLAGSGYLTVVKILEVVGGALLLTGLFVPLGITILTPIAVNILLYEVCILKEPGLGVGVTALCFVLVAVYWNHFSSVFAVKVSPKCCTTNHV